MSTRTVTLWLWAMLTVGTVGCDDASPTAPTGLDPALATMLSRAIQDEYRAETIYQGVITDFGPVLPFANILRAESRHSSAIARLYAARGLATPASEWTVQRVPHFTSVPAACAAGAVAERENIALCDELLGGELPADVRHVFTNNRSASVLSHLPAFELCS
jgi:hypothetical protein